MPSWTDRILYRGADIDLNRYSRAELKNSDHRPVMAVFRARVRTIDQARKEAISSELLSSFAGDTAVIRSARSRPASPVKRLAQPIGTPTSALPPPSDDQQAWWNLGSACDEVRTWLT